MSSLFAFDDVLATNIFPYTENQVDLRKFTLTVCCTDNIKNFFVYFVYELLLGSFYTVLANV